MKASGKKANKTKGMQDKRVFALLLALIIFVAIYEIAFVIGPSYFGDDTVYLNLANAVWHGGFTENAQIFSVRILNIYPISFFYIFGVNNLTSAAWAITSFLGSMVVAFYIGKELYNKYAGLLAALLLGFFPLFVVLSETPTPNVPEAFLTGLTILALILAMRKKSARLYFATGALLVASVLTTPLSGIMFGVVFVYLLIEFLRKKFEVNKTTINLLYGVICASVLLAIFNYLNSGNPPITFTVTDSVYSTAGTPAQGILINQDPKFYFQIMFPYNVFNILSSAFAKNVFNPIQIWQAIYSINYTFSGFYFYVFVLAAFYLLLENEKRSYLALLWFVLAFLYLEFGPIYLSLFPFKYILSHRLERYLATIAIPLVLVISIALVRFAQSAKKLRREIKISISAIIVLFLLLTSIPINLFWHESVFYQTYDQQTIAGYLNALPNSTQIYLLSGFANVLEYMGYNNMARFNIYDQYSNCTQIPQNSYVIVPKYLEVFGIKFTPNPLPYCPSWQLILYPRAPGNYSSSLQGSAMPFQAKLYYVPINSTNQTN